MLKEYDFSRGVRGKYVRRFSRGTKAVVLDPDVARVFSDANSVNEALRDSPELVNSDAFGAGWIVKLRVDEPSQVDEMLDAAGYAELTA